MKRSALFFRVLQVPVDALSIFAAAFLAYKLRVQPELFGGVLRFPLVEIAPLPDFLRLIAGFIPILIAIFTLAGLYNVKQPRKGFDLFAGLFLGIATGVALIVGYLFFTNQTLSSRLVVGYFWIFSIIIVVLARFLLLSLERFLYRYGVGVRSVVIVGTNGTAAALVKEILADRSLGMRLKGLIRSREGASDINLKGIPVIGELGDLKEILRARSVDEVLVADPQLPMTTNVTLLETAEHEHATVRIVPSLYEVRATNVEPSTIGRVPIVTYLRTPLDGWGRVFKRVFDLVGALIGILVLSPVFLVIAVGIKLTSSGPIFFSQKRISERKTFNCYKFRSMRVGANEQHQELMERHGVMFKLKQDPRVTRFGAYLRRSSLDELPQLWNVLRGEMSLVGPRPPMVEEVEHYSSWQRRRLHIKPGLTGLWQVSGRSDIPFDEWVRLDLTYIENWSIWLDITILLKTVWIVLKGKGAY